MFDTNYTNQIVNQCSNHQQMYEQIIYLENLFVFNSLLWKYFPMQTWENKYMINVTRFSTSCNMKNIWWITWQNYFLRVDRQLVRSEAAPLTVRDVQGCEVRSGREESRGQRSQLPVAGQWEAGEAGGGHQSLGSNGVEQRHVAKMQNLKQSSVGQPHIINVGHQQQKIKFDIWESVSHPIWKIWDNI